MIARRVAVAGGTGFIGRHVVRALTAAGVKVIVLSRARGSAETAVAGVEHCAVDLTTEVPTLPPCDAVVNLVGIKAERGANTFQGAHVDAVAHLVTAMKGAGVRRLVHVSVVALPATLGAYAATKRAGETLATEAGLDTTIVRPGLVIGPGDDAMTNLIRFIRLAPIFPVAAGQAGTLAVTDVRDVAAAIVQALARAETVGETIDIVGPQALPLRGLIAKVAGALRLPTITLPVPRALQVAAAAVLERLPGPPIVTRSQLALLQHGLRGSTRDAADKLGLSPRPLTDARIVELAQRVPDFAPSVRLAPTPDHDRWLAQRQGSLRRASIVVALAMAAMLVLPRWVPNIWIRMAVIEGAMAGLLIAATPGLRWRSMLAPSAKNLVVGLAGAVVLYAGCAAGFAALGWVAPGLAAQAAVIYAWSATMALVPQLALLTLTVAAEDIVWRAGVTIPVAARWGPGAGVAASAVLFALAHLTTGPPLLWIAALVCGAFWSALLIRTRSLAATVVAHLAWDLAVIYLAPY